MNVSFEDDANDDKENLYPWISSLYSSFHFKKEVNSWLFYKGQEQGTSAEEVLGCLTPDCVEIEGTNERALVGVGVP